MQAGREGEKERERNRQSRQDSGSRDSSGPTFSPPQPINRSDGPAPEARTPVTKEDPPAMRTPPRQREEPMTVSPEKGELRPPPGLPPPKVENVPTPASSTVATGNPSIKVSIDLSSLGREPDKLVEGVYDPLSTFRRDYVSTPQVSTELAGDLMDPNCWGRHTITNQED